LRTILEKYSFEIVPLESLSFKEQIKLFSEAKIVLGLHGAGLANVVFCNKQVQLCEIRVAGFDNFVFKVLAEELSIDYFSIELCDKIANMHFNDYIIPPKVFDQELGKIIQL
jgi:capsular polysaccharide biosynthesis protein